MPTEQDQAVPSEASPSTHGVDPDRTRPSDSKSARDAPAVELAQMPAAPGAGLKPDRSRNHARLTEGERLSGRYRIERVLGEGGMGVVYLARDEQVAGETFAIKVLKESLHSGALEVLRDEVRKTRKLSHPNIVDVHLVSVD